VETEEKQRIEDGDAFGGLMVLLEESQKEVERLHEENAALFIKLEEVVSLAERVKITESF
jgi:hypothetical protein